jgi:hypothetical protein
MKSLSAYYPLFESDHPREDYTSASGTAAVVADGVTLEANPDGSYPNPSGSGEVARIFCSAVMGEIVAHSENLNLEKLSDIFRAGNRAAASYNQSKGRVPGTLNYSDTDFFSTTTALGILQDHTLYWWSLCDAGVVILNAAGEIRFHSPPAWTPERREKYLIPALAALDLSGPERAAFIHEHFRNAKNDKGELIGYGLVTGEESAEEYLALGAEELQEGDTALVYKKIYGQERSIIAMRI